MNILKNLLWPEIEELIEKKRWEMLKSVISEWEAPDIADLLTDTPDDRDKIIIFRILPKDLASDVFSEIDFEDQMIILQKMSDQQVKEVLLDLEPDDRTTLFEELPGKILQKYLNMLPKDERREALGLLGYPDNSVGRLMTPNYLAVRPDWTVKDALSHIKQIGPDRETINVIYVTDSNWHFLDALMIKKFILADPKTVVRDIMDNAFVTLSPSDKQEEAVKLMEHYNLTSIPVVDSENILVGIVTFDDVMDVAEEEATVDFHKTAGISPFEQSYLDIGVFPLFSRRVVWLFCLVFVNTISGMIISHFEQTISLCVSLVFFMPLLSSSAGNTGLQASTLVIRSMATENTNFKNSILIILKDLCVAIMIGLVMGVAVLLLGLLRGNIYVGISATIAMILVVIISSFLGTILPMILRILKFDPAVASAPLITSCCDIINVAIYFSVAKWVLESFTR